MESTPAPQDDSPHTDTPPEEWRGRFPGLDVAAQSRHWDQATADKVLARVGPRPPIRFFTPAQLATADALCRGLLALQPDCPVPVLAMLDDRLSRGDTDGWRYDDMPEDAEAWRASLAAIEADAAERFDAPFPTLDDERRDQLIGHVRELGSKPWHGMSAGHVWSLWTRYTSTAFYAHPFAWNEIGFPGPAYPQGYKNVGVDKLESKPREVQDQGRP